MKSLEKKRRNAERRRESDDEDDEAGYRFNTHPFRPGEYVSIKDDDGDLHTFQVVTVQDL